MSTDIGGLQISPVAGRLPTRDRLVNLTKLIGAYSALKPDPSEPAQQISFGTSGHRGSSFNRSFNEDHVLAITQAICLYRQKAGTTGPLFIGFDTHALSLPAFESALEVLVGNAVTVLISKDGEYTPTPAISHAILSYNRGRSEALADGIVITPSHNPPEDGGFKYNPTNGGPAETNVTAWIENCANRLLAGGLREVKRMSASRARQASTTRAHDYLEAYTADLEAMIDFDAIRSSGIRMGVDPLGGAGVHYWARIAERFRIDLTVVSEQVDPSFAFMTQDWDGRIRMDPSSPYAMHRLIGLKDEYDIAFACDTDHDRHGIVAPTGLMPPNHFLSVAIDYLFQHRPEWNPAAAVGKTLVSSAMIDRVAIKLRRKLVEVPVGFKWFVNGLIDGSLGFGGEESAGATFLRRDGKVWTTDKDGIAAALLSAEITARQKAPDLVYADLVRELGGSTSDRIDAPANAEQKRRLASLAPNTISVTTLAGESINSILSHAPGNGAPIGGIKIVAENGWFAARPSGTEDIYKIYAESFIGDQHLRRILREAQAVVDTALAS